MGKKRVSPRSTAFEPDLYAVASTGVLDPNRDPHIIETGFLQKIDTAAAVAHQKLVHAGPDSLTDDDKRAWALFLNSLLERNRATVLGRLKEAPAIGAEAAAKIMARVKEETRARMAGVFEVFDAVTASKNMVHEFMAREIRDPKVISYFMNCGWTVLTVETGPAFITTDAPLLVNAGASASPIDVLTLALDPSKLFIMHPASWKTTDNEVIECAKSLGLGHNLLLLKAGCRCVYSRDPITDGGPIRLRSAVDDFLSRDRSEPLP
jgi:hypothetical protein